MNVFCLKHIEVMTVVVTKNIPKYTIVARCESCSKDNPNSGVRVTLEPIREDEN